MKTSKISSRPIGINLEKTKELVQKINQLSVNYSVFYQNTIRD